MPGRICYGPARRAGGIVLPSAPAGAHCPRPQRGLLAADLSGPASRGPGPPLRSWPRHRGSAPRTFDPSCCQRRGRRGPRGHIPLGICSARPVRGACFFLGVFYFLFFCPGAFCPQLRGGAPAPGKSLRREERSSTWSCRSGCFYSCFTGVLQVSERFWAARCGPRQGWDRASSIIPGAAGQSWLCRAGVGDSAVSPRCRQAGGTLPGPDLAAPPALKQRRPGGFLEHLAAANELLIRFSR